MCDNCDVKGEGGDSVPPTLEEEQLGASRVEGYTCPKCHKSIRFPRYNHPEKLLGE